MHQLWRPEDRVHRASLHALEAADALGLADERHGRRGSGLEFGIKGDGRQVEELRECADGCLAAGRAAVDRRASGNGLGVRTAAGMAAARALRLRQAVLDALYGERVDGYFTCIPGTAPLSGESRKISFPPGPAASTMPCESPKRIFRGARFATTTTSRPTSDSGA